VAESTYKQKQVVKMEFIVARVRTVKTLEFMRVKVAKKDLEEWQRKNDHAMHFMACAAIDKARQVEPFRIEPIVDKASTPVPGVNEAHKCSEKWFVEIMRRNGIQ
jgi:hypothetical protein